MSVVPFPDYLQQMPGRLKEVQGQIVLAMAAVAGQPEAAYASFHELDQTISGMEHYHSTWASTYFPELRSRFGPGSEPEQVYQPVSDDVSQNLTRMHIWVLMGAGESAAFLGRLDEAQQSAAAGAELCGARADLVAERNQFLLQLAFTSYRKNELPAARDAALRAHDAALSGSLWVNAAQALVIAALCALLLDDRESLTDSCSSAARLVVNHSGDSQMSQLGRILQDFRFAALSALDKTGRTEAERDQLAADTMRSVMKQIKQQTQ